ncbi:MAG: GTPase ObgE [Chloroflexi bacterium]|nr:GTPase ObgE [Chloroflexota bacterium]|tara:strand:- start:41182 stop:42432 length:1251 start_codon:yes stop_codon:yes gene_type:complete
MIDEVLITIKAGNGGDGCISGRKEKFVSAGGPDGGDGGKGGDIIVKASHNLNTLNHIRNGEKFFATDGHSGKPRLKHGSDSNNLIIEVPVGTYIYKDEESDPYAELLKNKDEVVLQHGGSGGKGNKWFVSPVNRFPLLAEKGVQTTSKQLKLEMRILAEVGIVGLPNAGKSTTLSRISKAKPKIAGYPFTTLEPVIGMVNIYNDEKTIKVIEVPGLIEGAHKGAGLGIEFLKHAKKTQALIHLVDGTSSDIKNDIGLIDAELKMSQSGLNNKPKLLVINKVDQMNIEKSSIKEMVYPLSPVFISALTGEGLSSLLESIETLLKNIPCDRVTSYIRNDVPVKIQDEINILKKDGVFIVEYRKGERVSGMVDFRDWNAKAQWNAFLEKAGVFKKLIDYGIEEGSLVRIGEAEWKWGNM